MLQNNLQHPLFQPVKLHRLDDRLRVARDHQFLLRGDNKDAHLGCGRGNFSLYAVQRLRIDLIVNLNAEIRKIAADVRADKLPFSPMPPVKTIASTPSSAAT